MLSKQSGNIVATNLNRVTLPAIPFKDYRDYRAKCELLFFPK